MLKEVGYDRIRPLKGVCTIGWGNTVFYEKTEGGKGFRGYCKSNSYTEEGLKAIAKYNGYYKEWKEETNLFTDRTFLAQIRFISSKLYAK